MEAGRQLPLEIPFATTTLAQLLEPDAFAPAGPRETGYGPAGAWLRRDAASGVLRGRTRPVPETASLVAGVFRGPDRAAAALRHLMATPDFARASLVAVEWMDERTLRWSLGSGAQPAAFPPSESALAMTVRLEGGRETVARGARSAWQALELSGAKPWRLALPPTAARAVHPDLPPGGTILAARCDNDAVPPLYDALGGVADLLGSVGARAWPALGALFAYLPPHARQAEAIAWGRERASAVGGRVRRLDPQPHRPSNAASDSDAAPTPATTPHRDTSQQGDAP